MPQKVPPKVAAARRKIAQVVTEREALLRASAVTGSVDHARLTEIDVHIGGLLDGVFDLVDPCDASEVDPLVLLPVRLETRFGASGAQATLRVRIYPDEIHVDDLDRGLTVEETDAGQAYWTSVWTDPAPATAWVDFVSAVGSGRAEWVAHACTPSNLTDRGTAPTPDFPKVTPRGPRSVVARSLPDRFVVLAIQDGQVSEAVGKPIPRDLSISPIPMAGDEPTRVADALTVPPGSEWLIDYDAAVQVGMGVTVPLAGGHARVDRVIAIGTRGSLTPSASAAELEDLLTGHRFGAGLDLLSQGTPTNNADAERSPYRSRTTPQAPPLAPPTATPGSDTAAAADALGVDPALLTGLVGDGTGEQAIAGCINAALWAPGWGEYLSRLDEQGVPGVVDAQRESARRLFRDRVRGRGTSPAIRVGAQPYGVLAASNLDAWVPQAGETTAGIANVVRTLMARWLYAAEHTVPRVRPGTGDIETVLLDVLGSSPVMQGLRVRPVISDDVSAAVIAALGLDHREYEAERMSTAAVISGLLGNDASRMVIGSLHRETRPLPLPLASPRDPEFITALLGAPQKVLPIDSVLQALLVLAWQSSELDVAKASPASVLPALVDLVAISPRLKARTTAVMDRADKATVAELHAVVSDLRRAGVEVGGPSMLAAFQPVQHVQTSLAEVALSSPATAEARSMAGSALAGWLLAMGYRNEVRSAMQAMTTTGLEARRLAVAEALDCSSHRLDAWATAVVAERRALQVARKRASASKSTRGLTIGAYGVVEGLVPQAGSILDGWIHAPSTQHASAAGMLRSSHLSHLPSSGPPGAGGPFAIDLSSRRIQSATHIIDGVRQGQQLGALVGYRIERSLADSGLARLQLSLRAIAPLVARRLHDADGLDAQAAQEAVAAANVVDGVLLLKKHAPGDLALRAALDTAPVNAYLEAGDWDALTNGEWATVTGIMAAAADTIDAVADIMLSESVLQFAGGNAHRAAAAMDAMSTGAGPSDTIDVLEARDSGERLTHRFLALVGGSPPTSAWNSVRPRSLVEPHLEAWAAAHLGDPASIVVADAAGRRITMAESGFAALDLVFATDLVTLERTLRALVPDLGDEALAVTRDPAWPAGHRALGQVVGLAGTVRTMIAGSHPLLPGDLARPGVPATRDLTVALPDVCGRAAALAGILGAAVSALAGTVATIPASGIVADEGTAAALTTAIYALEPFGIPLEPTPGLPLDVSWIRSAWEGARARGMGAQACVDRLVALPTDTPAALVLEAAQQAVSAVFGDGFVVVPLLAPGTGADGFVEAVVDPAFAAPPAPSVRRFVRDVGTVRPQVTRLSEVLLLAGALGHPRTVEVIQLTERSASGPTPGTTQWLAGPLPANGPWPASPAAHLVVDRVGTIDEQAAIAGLAIDAWVEDLPAQVGPNADPADPRPGSATTGLAIRSNSASARPPQAVLCAVSPDGKRWTTDSLRGVIESTLDLARVRMVTLERLAGEGLMLPALYTRSSSLQGQSFIDFTALAELKSAFVSMPFVKEVTS